jgi:hypothetical protein
MTTAVENLQASIQHTQDQLSGMNPAANHTAYTRLQRHLANQKKKLARLQKNS